MNPLKKLAGETAIYGVSSIFGRLLNYFLVTVHTTVLPTGNYGIITELYALVAFLNVIYAFGLETSFFRFSTKEKALSDDVYNTAFTLVFGISFVLSSSLIFMDTAIVNSMDYAGNENFIWIFAGILFLDAIQAIPFAKIRLENKPKLFAVARLAGIATNILINLFFLLFCYNVYEGNILPQWKNTISLIYNPEYNLEYIFIANLAASLVSGLWIFKYFKKVRLKIYFKFTKTMLKYGYPVMFTGLAIVTNEMLSRLALKYWLPENFYPGFSNQEILGVFGGVFKLAVLMNLGVQAFRYAAEPFFFSHSENKNSPKLFADVMKWFVIFGCLVFLGVSLNLNILQYLLGKPEYRTAIDVVPLLLIASLFTGINYNLSAWYKLIDKTSIGTKITVLGALFTIIANYILIPIYGYYGSAWASIGAYFLMSVISYFLGKKLNPFPYQTTRLLLYVLVSALLSWFLLSFDMDGVLRFIVFNGIALLWIGALVFYERRSLIH